MSTKTTFKRIALVTVAALGFGVLTSVAPASAVASTFTTAATLSTSSMTVVATSTGASYGGKFYLDLTGNGTLDGKYPGLNTGESISVTVTAPSGGAAGDLGFQAMQLANNNNTAGVTSASGGFTAVGAAQTATSTLSGAFQIPSTGLAATGAAVSGAYASNNWAPDANSATGYANRFWMSVYPVNGTPVALNAIYTVTVRVHTNDSATSVIVNTLSVKFVTSVAESGATITVSKSGDLYNGEELSVVSGRYVRASVTNGTAGGRVWLGCATATLSTSCIPQLNAQWVPISGTPSTTDSFTVSDTGVVAVDHLAVVNTTYANNSTSTAAREFANGSYGVTEASIGQAAAADTVLRLSITGGSTASRVDSAIIIRDATTARDLYTDLSMSATGSVAYTSTAAITTATAGDVARTDVDSSTTWVLPLSTTSGTLTINADNASNVAVAGVVLKVTPTWSGSFVSTDVSPATSTTGTSYTTDASGNIAVAFSNTAPVNGGKLTLVITGFASGVGTIGTGSRTVVIDFQKSVVTSMTVLDPNQGVYVKAGSTTTFTVEVDDQFGNGMAGEVIQPAITDTSAEQYVLNKTYATITTGASGTASWTLTDAKAAADLDYDTVVFKSITDTTKTVSATITYVLALPVVSTVNVYFDVDKGDSATGLVGTSSIGTFAIQKARNQSRSLASFTDSATDDFISMRARALTSASVAAEGAACTVSASAGAHLLGAANTPVSSRTFAVDASGDLTWTTLATTVGTKTYTITCGTVVKTATMVVTNAAADARFITITGGSTGTANGAGVPVSVKVTDRFGNGVATVALTLSASGAGSFSGGATTQSFTTDASGSYTFNATSTVDAGGVGTFSVSAASTAEFAAAAGKSYGPASTYVTVDSDVAAGNSSASLAITFAAGESAVSVAATAAADAAAEATDAANAATDAANAAAEAADAATAAAQDAADAVAALATSVEAMVNALKRQITSLTNLVIKIQKKVRA